ncbi:MAG TPA: HNH endonuclease [bacterium]|nr:HNH endonuclease [bacterium]
MYFIVDWQEIRIPYDPGILKTIDGRTYSDKHAIQGTQILEGQNAMALQDYLSANTDDLLPFEEPSDNELHTPLDVLLGDVTDTRPLELKLEGIPTKELETRFSKREIKLMIRDPRLARMAKEREKYVCQICGALPFVQNGGNERLYAEAHHIMELSKGGADLLGNMLCVCPTCHRVLHYGTPGALDARKTLKKMK